jgi:hypothetical protein
VNTKRVIIDSIVLVLMFGLAIYFLSEIIVELLT